MITDAQLQIALTKLPKVNPLVPFEVPGLEYVGPGLSSRTSVWMCRDGSGIWEARVGLDILGMEELPKWADKENPFVDKFCGSVEVGRGVGPLVALRAMYRRIEELQRIL